MYFYQGFGLNIISEIEFPELLPAVFEIHDLRISLHTIPDDVLNVVDVDNNYSTAISSNSYYLDLDNVCKYYAYSGADIYLQPYDNADWRSVRLFILGTIISAILLQRGRFPFHVSAIVKNGKLILFSGDSGAGKSTTLAQLVLKGYKIFTDDICIMHLTATEKNVQVTGTASYPMLKLWKDAANRLRDDVYDKEDYNVRPGIEKYGHFFFDEFDTNAYPVDKIFLLTTDAMQEDIVELSGFEAFKELERYAIYRRHQLHTNVLKQNYFTLISHLANNCKVYKLNMQLGYENKPGYKPFPVHLL